MATAEDRAATAELTERVLGAVQDGRDELVQAISAAVQIPSVNPRYPGQVYDDVVGGEGQVARFVADVYRELGAEVDVFGLEPGRENAVGVIRGAGGGRSLIYNGHVDVVPAGRAENWRYDPFSGRVDDDRIWGRGSTDMKAGVLAQAFAARAPAQRRPAARRLDPRGGGGGGVHEPRPRRQRHRAAGLPRRRGRGRRAHHRRGRSRGHAHVARSTVVHADRAGQGHPRRQPRADPSPERGRRPARRKRVGQGAGDLRGPTATRAPVGVLQAPPALPARAVHDHDGCARGRNGRGAVSAVRPGAGADRVPRVVPAG